MSPVVHRELLVQGRFWGNYWLRVLTGGMGVVVIAGFWLIRYFTLKNGNGTPPELFNVFILGACHAITLGILALGGALMTADCLARERREGTFELLLLTPLSPGEIVWGKCLSQLVRLGTVWLSMVPLFTVPLMLGGVSLTNLRDALLAQLVAALSGVTAGMLATARGRHWGWTICFSVALLGGLYLMYVVLANGIFYAGIAWAGKTWDKDFYGTIPFLPGMIGLALPLEGPLTRLGAPVPAWLISGARAGLWTMAGISVTVFLLALWWVFLVIIRGRQAPTQAGGLTVPAPPLAAEFPAQPASTGWWWKAKLQSLFRPPRWLLDFHPSEWLEARSVLFAVGIRLLPGMVLAGWFGILLTDALGGLEVVGLGRVGPFFLLLLATFLAAASFRQEHEDGTLELLLCTPVRPHQLLAGRLRAMRSLLGPAFFLALWLALIVSNRNPQFNGGVVVETWMRFYDGGGWWFAGLGAFLWLGVHAVERVFHRACRWPVRGLAAVVLLVALLWVCMVPWDLDSDQSWGARKGLDGLVILYLGSAPAMLGTAWWCAFRKMHPIIGTAAGVLFGVAVPYLFSGGAIWLWWWAAGGYRSGASLDLPRWLPFAVAVVVQAIVAGVAAGLIRYELRANQFQHRA